MLATRIIPTLLCSGRQLIKGRQFNSWRVVGSAAQAVRVFNQRGCDELCLIDIKATQENRGPDLKLIAELAEICFMPLAVGGGIRTVDQVRELLAAGADKVILGQALWEDPYLACKISRKFGSQALIAAADYRLGRVCHSAGRVHTKAPIGSYCEVLAAMGAGEILLTNVDAEGTMAGYDCSTLANLRSRCIPIPVIAHGGCGSYEHMARALHAGADAVAAGSMFQFLETTPAEAAECLARDGFNVRVRERVNEA